jgi:hypothetical protein
MTFRTAMIEFVAPLFLGALCSLFICALIAFDTGIYSKPPPVYRAVIEYTGDDSASLLFAKTEETPDPVLEYYRNPSYKDVVVEFFTGICLDREISFAILDNSDRLNVSPALAFAVCWEESRFNPSAVNRHNRDGSIDRGLFQLNSRSFPYLSSAAFFDVRSNAFYGISHLRYCLDTGGTEVSALAVYNAGAGRVQTTGAPQSTLNYISRILENRRRIEMRFNNRIKIEEENRKAAMEETALYNR